MLGRYCRHPLNLAQIDRPAAVPRAPAVAGSFSDPSLTSTVHRGNRLFPTGLVRQAAARRGRPHSFQIDRDWWGDGRAATDPIGIGNAARQKQNSAASYSTSRTIGSSRERRYSSDQLSQPIYRRLRRWSASGIWESVARKSRSPWTRTRPKASHCTVVALTSTSWTLISKGIT